MKHILYLLTLLMVVFSLMSAAPEYRVFESTDGATIEAIVIEASVTTVTIQRKDGKEFKNVPLDRFSVNDRKYVREWREAKEKAIFDANLEFDSQVKITVLKGEDDDKNNYGDIDDRVVHFEPTVIAESNEKELTFRDVKGTLVIIGKGVIEKDSHVILNKQDFTIDMIPRERTRWEGSKFQCRYDPDFGGFEYEGYLVILRNKQGQPVIIKASRSVWEQNFNEILKAKRFIGYDRDFGKSHSLYTTFGLPSG